MVACLTYSTCFIKEHTESTIITLNSTIVSYAGIPVVVLTIFASIKVLTTRLTSVVEWVKCVASYTTIAPELIALS